MGAPLTIKVKLWGTTIGYLHQEENQLIGFQYDDDFLNSGIEISPIKMPLSDKTYMFPELPETSYHGLPGLISDSLPDKFGSIVITRFLERQGRTADDLTILELIKIKPSYWDEKKFWFEIPDKILKDYIRRKERHLQKIKNLLV